MLTSTPVFGIQVCSFLLFLKIRINSSVVLRHTIESGTDVTKLSFDTGLAASC